METKNITAMTTKKTWVRPTINKICKDEILGGSKTGNDAANKSK